MSDRRTFIKDAALLATAASGLYALENSSAQASLLKPSRPNPKNGQYQATVPDTLDLTERCRLGLHGVAGTSDPQCYGQMWFSTNFACRHPYLSHAGADGACTPKFAESFPLLRFACGSDEWRELEQLQMDNLVANIESDGLYYSVWKPDRPWHSFYYDAKPEDFCWVGGAGRMMRAMMTWRMRDGDSRWDDRVRAMARGLRKIGIDKGDYIYWPDGGHSHQFAYPKTGWRKTDEPQSDAESAEGSVLDSYGHPIYALARWYQKSGDKESLDTARKVVAFATKPKMWGGLAEEISVDGREQGHFYSHFHGHLSCLRGLLQYGWAAEDDHVLEFVRRSYEHGRTYMIPRIGWMGHNGVGECGFAMEACALGDLVAIGVRMSDLGLGDYWEDVDYVVRNMLAEQQLTDLERLKKIAAASPDRAGKSSKPKQETEDQMPERILGIFASFSLPNQLPGGGVMGCCTANATQGLYFAWDGALRCTGDTATVNLLVNRASPLADVDSYIPYEGKVVVHNKAARRLFIRIFSWIDLHELRLTVDGHEHPLIMAGRYLFIDDLKPNSTIMLQFPLRESTTTYTAHRRVWRKEKQYTYAFRGSTVMEVTPKETSPANIPIFERGNMRNGPAPMRQVVRVVSNQPPLEW